MIHRAIEIAKREGVLSLARKSWDFVKYRLNFKEKLHRLLLPYAIWKLKRAQFNSLEELVEFSFNWLFGIIRPMQIKEEILQLLKILAERRPKVILEIGTANGGTLFLFTRVASDDAIIVSVDLPEGKFGGGYPDWKVPLYKSFARKNQQVHLIRADSHDPETFEKVKRILNDRKVDFLFIDGDHTYEGVKKDFEMYSKLVAEREHNSFTRHGSSSVSSRMSGRKVLERDQAQIQNERDNFFEEPNLGRDWDNTCLVVFHDIVPGPEHNVGGVPKFWQETKRKYRCKEIVKDWNQGGYGLGILFRNY